jgi:hypothetical protein
MVVLSAVLAVEPTVDRHIWSPARGKDLPISTASFWPILSHPVEKDFHSK